jgi:hypothetical protein
VSPGAEASVNPETVGERLPFFTLPATRDGAKGP